MKKFSDTFFLKFRFSSDCHLWRKTLFSHTNGSLEKKESIYHFPSFSFGKKMVLIEGNGFFSLEKGENFLGRSNEEENATFDIWLWHKSLSLISRRKEEEEENKLFSPCPVPYGKTAALNRQFYFPFSKKKFRLPSFAPCFERIFLLKR